MRKRRILVVGDQLSVIKFLLTNLEANGYEVLAAVDGAEALQTFEREPTLSWLTIMIPLVKS